MEKSNKLIRFTLGFIYFHFGMLKFFSDLSPAEVLAELTITELSLHFIDATTAINLLAILEIVIGIGFLFNIKPKWVLYLFLFHMAGTFIPLFVIPQFVFKIAPFAPTIEGQYILKNIVYVAVGLSVLYPQLKSQETIKKKKEEKKEGSLEAA